MYTTYIIIIWGSLVIYGGLDAAFNIQDTLAASENRSKAKKEKSKNRKERSPRKVALLILFVNQPLVEMRRLINLLIQLLI